MTRIILSPLIFFSRRVYLYVTYISDNIKWKKKIIRLNELKGSVNLSKEQVHEVNNFYQKIGLKGVNYDWHKFYISCNKKFSPAYLPENLFYLIIEPNLNRPNFVEALQDKNLLENLFPKIKTPVSIVKNINGFYKNQQGLVSEKIAINTLRDQKKYIIKPTQDTGGGKNVILFRTKNGKTDFENLSILELFRKYEKDFVVQDVLVQHPLMNELNPTSINTFRFLTYLNNDNVQILSVILRIGREGSFTDNSSTGGISCGVGLNGNLTKMAFQNKTTEMFVNTDNGVDFENFKIPFMPKLMATVKNMHCQVPYFKLVSWDLSIDKDENVILIEFNVKGQEINFHQVCNGPIFESVLIDMFAGLHNPNLKHNYRIII